MVRRSHSDVRGVRREDRLTIYPEGGKLRALYLDNEGHAIHYSVIALPDGVAFVSDPGAGPRFRQTYRRAGGETVSVVYEIAPPGHPEAFSTYLQIATRRQP